MESPGFPSVPQVMPEWIYRSDSRNLPCVRTPYKVSLTMPTSSLLALYAPGALCIMVNRTCMILQQSYGRPNCSVFQLF